LGVISYLWCMANHEKSYLLVRWLDAGRIRLRRCDLPGLYLAAEMRAPVSHPAASRRVRLSSLCERELTLGPRGMVSTRSRHGSVADDEGYRIAAPTDPGFFLLRTARPEPNVALAGTRRILRRAFELLGHAAGNEGYSRAQSTQALDPGRVRQLRACQVRWVQHRPVARARTAPTHCPYPAVRARHGQVLPVGQGPPPCARSHGWTGRLSSHGSCA
jgi:hypothetical protein